MMVVAPRRLVARLACSLTLASLTILAVADVAVAQTQIARNRFKNEVAFQAEPVPDTGAKAGRFLLRGPSGYLIVPGTAVQVAPLTSARNWTGHWVMRRLSDGYVHFINERTGSTLHFETGTAQVGAIQPAWWSAMWSVTTGSLFASTPTPIPTAAKQLMVNRWKSDVAFEIEPIYLTRVRLRTTAGYLSMVNGRIGISSTVIPTTQTASSDWFFAPVPPATSDCTRPDCFFRLASPVGTGSLNNEGGPLTVGAIRDDWYSAMWSRIPGAATPSTAVPPIAGTATPVASNRNAMTNRWKPEVAFEIVPVSLTLVRLRTTAGFLSVVGGRVGITPSIIASTPTSSSDWQLAPVPPSTMDCTGVNCFFRLTSPVAAGSLNNETGSLVVGTIRDDWYSAMWNRVPTTITPSTAVPVVATTPTPVPSVRVAMMNRSKPELAFEVEPVGTGRVRLRTAAGYLSVVDGRFGLTPAIVANGAAATSEWNLTPIAPATANCIGPDCFFRLASPVVQGALHAQQGPLIVSAYALDWPSAMWTRTNVTATPTTFVPAMPAANPTTPTLPPLPTAVANRFRAEVKLQPVRPNGPADTAYVHLRTPSGGFVVVDNRRLETVTAGYGSYLGMWRIEPIPGQAYVRIVNRMTGDYLHTEGGPLGIGTVAAGTMNMNWWSGMWTITR